MRHQDLFLQNPAELIETENMARFMDKAKKEYDYIIFDTPPIAIVTDALLLAGYSDVNLFIVRQRYTSRSTLNLIEQLRTHGELKEHGNNNKRHKHDRLLWLRSQIWL